MSAHPPPQNFPPAHVWSGIFSSRDEITTLKTPQSNLLVAVNSEVYVLGNRVACFHLTENPAEVNGGYLKIQQGATVKAFGTWELEITVEKLLGNRCKTYIIYLVLLGI